MTLLPARLRQLLSRRGVHHVLSSRVGRRILLMFLLAAGLPVALAALVGYQAVTGFLDQQTQRTLHRSTRDAGMQVLGRLQEADSILSAWPALCEAGSCPADAGASAADARLAAVRMPGLNRVFRGAQWLDVDGQVRLRAGVVGAPLSADLVRAWAVSGKGLPVVSGASGMPQQYRARLLVERLAQRAEASTTRPRIWLVRTLENGYWVAEVAPEHLWAPLVETAAQARWRVFDATQQALVQVPEGGSDPVDGSTGRWSLFLGGEFGAADWVLEQRLPPARFELAGLPLLRWAVQLGGLVLLVVALLSLTQIRRTLVPLEALVDGTRRLARHERTARVRVHGADEFGELARSFNDMAGRIDVQFQSLEALALIDRSIVAGRPVEEVLDQLLQQVLQRTGATAAGVIRQPLVGGAGAHRAQAQPLALQWLCAEELQLLRGEEACVLLEADRPYYEQWSEPAPWPPQGSRGLAWNILMPRLPPQHWWAWPVTWQDGGRALLLLGFARRPGQRRRQEATELCGRLAVALAAYQREQTLHWRALHDDLTGLANRHGLNERLDHRLEEAGHSELSVMFIDLDRFKTVNDTLGHEMGDRLLQQASERLQALAPRDAVVARAGGDEFVLVLPGAGEEQAAELARQICERMAVPFLCGGHEHALGASIGIAVSPRHGHDRATLMRHADMAMYQAKQGGRGRYAVFADALDEAMSERSRLLADLRRAVERDELLLHYQPRVQSADGQIRSAEALVRWQHPELGFLMPGRFIALAEESDLIEAVGTCVLRLACAQIARWRRGGLTLDRVSVNVSPRQLMSGRLVGEVDRALSDFGVPPEALELEVTESLLVGDAQAACDQLQALRERGVLIALDDFGTGYSSLSTLRQLPIDVMKVDRAFVKDLGQDDTALAVTQTILTLAKALGKHTVAEGMETAEQADMLRELGCDEMQGYYFSKPLAPEVFAALPQLAAGRSRPGAEQDGVAGQPAREGTAALA